MTESVTVLPAPSHSGSRRNVVSRWVADRGIATKINAAVLLMAIVALAVGGLAIVRMAQMSRNADDLYVLGVVPIQQIDQIKIDMEQTRRNVLNHAVSHSAASMAKYQRSIADNDTAFHRRSADLPCWFR